MNKVYKVIWNASIGAWVATSEIAKSKTKTKSKTLNVSAAVLSGVICFAPNAFAGTNTEGGIGQGTSISGTTSCREGSANTANQKDIAIGCGAQTQDRTGSNIANRNNPYNNSTGAYAGAMKQGGAISVGTGAVVEKGLGTAIGSYATTQGISGVAIGTGALSSGNTALAVGRQSAATADFSQAIGNVAAATGKGSLAIGHSATAEGYRSIAIGSPDIENADPVAGQAGAAYQPKMATKATGKDSIAFGGGAVATEENALAIGAFSESKGKKSVAIGTGAKAQKDNAVVIGDQAEASFEGGVAIGKGARSEAENSIALGKDSKASQATGESFLTKQSAPTGVLSIGDIGTERRIQNVADGAADSDAATVRQLKAARTHYVSINDNGQQGGNFENDGATGRNAIAVGVNASAAGREAMAIGGSAQAIGSGAIAMGSSSQTVGRGDVAIGGQQHSHALGNSTANNLGGGASYDSTTGAVSSPTYTVNGNNVNNVGDAITALDKGWTLQSNGTNAAAVKAGDTVDIGTVAGETNLNVTKTGNTIQYGLNRDLNIDSVTAGDSKLDTNGLTIAGGPSVTKTGIDAAGNTISNVAAGTNATDAVNKGQLDHVDNRVTQVTNTTASIFGGGAKANTDGSISNPTYNVAGTSANNVGDALTALDKAVTDAGTAANAGWTVSANGDAATAKKIKPNGKVNFTGDDNLTVAQSSETDNEGNIKVALNKNLKVDSVTTGNTVIDTTGVKVGDNVQLGSTGLIIAGGPSITTSGISAGNKTISNVAAGVSSTDAVNKGQLDSAISSINNNVGALANSAVQYDKNSDGSVNKDSITLAGGANGTTIKNVANGTVAEGSKDAVNGGQLWTVQQQVNKNTGDISNLQTDISNINNGKSGLVQQADKDAAITVGKDTGGTQVNVAGTAGERTVTGVKAGAVTESSKDAVNGSQLNTTNQALVNYLGGGAGYDNITQSFSNPTYNVGDQSYHNVGDAIGALNQADQTLNTKIDNVSNKLEQAFYATNQRIDDVEKRANAGIAAAMALENAPFVAGKYTYAVGAAYHGGENAVGVTLRKTADNGRWSLTGGVAAASQGDPSVRIGISGVID
nr:ESPR-type extended signal peptide-containing protein [Acinetobacter baumannii]